MKNLKQRLENGEVKRNLCRYDKRNPNFDDEDVKQTPCACDNCFYRRTDLAY